MNTFDDLPLFQNNRVSFPDSYVESYSGNLGENTLVFGNIVFATVNRNIVTIKKYNDDIAFDADRDGSDLSFALQKYIVDNKIYVRKILVIPEIYPSVNLAFLGNEALSRTLLKDSHIYYRSTLLQHK